jgi:non-specific serine/threonine protein kinase
MDELGSGLTLTETNAVLGTPQYMAPEQIRGSHVDHRADLWAMAVIAFECLTGVRPFRALTLGDLTMAICSNPAPVPSLVASVPDGFDAWFATGADRDPARRFQSGGELAEALASLCTAAPALVRNGDDPGSTTRALTATDVGPSQSSVASAPARTAARPLLLAIAIEAEAHLMQRLGDDYSGLLTEQRELFRSVALARGGVICDESSGSATLVFSQPEEALEAAVQLQRLSSEHHWPQGSVVRWQMVLDASDRAPTRAGVSTGDLRRVRELSAIAHGGQILLTSSAREQLSSPLPEIVVIDLGEHYVDADRPAMLRLFHAHAPGLLGDFAPVRVGDAARHNLPSEATEFVGRSRELRDVEELLAESRLVTLVGPGGIGKSRLARRAAARRVGASPDGVFFVPLAAVRDPQFVASAVAGVLGLVEQGGRPAIEVLVQHLAEREMLLVLDNFEQVIGAAGDLARLIREAPKLSLLVTSRVMLHQEGERVFAVPPLATPAPEEAIDLDDLQRHDAVGLFVNGARRVNPDFSLNERNAPAIAEIVRLLDGLPLAIELAAARTRLFPPDQLRRELKQRQGTLRDDSGDVARRHQALHDVVAWSHDLLSPAERALFRRLAIFVGGFTPLNADSVVADPLIGEVTAGLRQLVDKSLVRREVHEGRERLVMLECIREFALEELEKTDEGRRLRERHAQVYRDLAIETEPDLQREGATSARDHLAAENGNLRAALEWCLHEGAADNGIEIAASIWRYWQSVGRLQEGRRWLVELLAKPDLTVSARAKGLSALAGLAYWQGDYPSAISRYREALDLYRDLGDRLNVGSTIFGISTSTIWSGDSATGERLANEALEIFDDLGAREQIGMVRMAQGFARWMQGDLAGARPLWETSVQIAREVGDGVEAAHKALALASITFQQGRPDEALRDSIAAMNELLERRNVALTVMAIDWIAAMIVERAPELGAQLAGAAAQLRGPLGGGMKPEACGLPIVRAVASERLTTDQFTRAYNAGRRLSLPHAVELARRVIDLGATTLIGTSENTS